MALKPTIFKFAISVSDIDRHYFDTLDLTVAQHPSETLERMMVRVLAYCLNADSALKFAGGLSTSNEPDLWSHQLDGRISVWLDVGEPGFDRIKKAVNLSSIVKVYSFNQKSHTWWQRQAEKFSSMPVDVYQFPWSSIQSLALLVERTMVFSITISGGIIFIATPLGELEIVCSVLQEKNA